MSNEIRISPPEPDKASDFSAALVAALGEFEEVPKGQKVQAGNIRYNFADLGSVLTYVRPILAGHGLAIMQPVSSDGDDVMVVTEIHHTSGAFASYGRLTMPRGQTPQQTGSAITYARRYSLLSTLGLATVDDDGAAASKADPRTVKAAEGPKPNTAARKRVYEIAGKNAKLALQWWEDGASTYAGKGPDDELTPDEADAVIQHAETLAEEQATKLSVEPAKNRQGGVKARRAAAEATFDVERWQGTLDEDGEKVGDG